MSSGRSTLQRPNWRTTVLHYVLQPIYLTASAFHRLFGKPIDHRGAAWESRLRYGLFAQGLPMLAAIVLIGVTAGMSWRETFRRVADYSEAARAAFDAGDFEAAALYYERLTNLQPDVEQFRYNLAISCAKLGDEARAAALITPLAPRDRLGFAPAHLWVAHETLNMQPPASREELLAAEAHLLRLRHDAAGMADAADEGLTEIYARQGRLEEIRNDPRLTAAAKRRPDLRLLMALASARAWRFDEAAAEARELMPQFRRRVEDFPDDDEARRRLAEAYALLGEEAALVDVLRKGIIVHPDGPFGVQLAEAMLGRAARLGQSSTATDREKGAARTEALELVERYGRDVPRLTLLAGQMLRRSGDLGEAERRYQAVVDELPAVRMELAEIYLQTDRADAARQQWEAYLADCRRTLDEGRSLTDGERMLAAVAARRLDRFADAERWLSEGNTTPEFHAALAHLYAAWWDEMSDEPPSAEQVELLRKGLRRDPWNASLLARLLTAARTDDERGAAAKAEMKQMITIGNIPGPAYLLLGTDAFERGDRETAARYLAQAKRLDPKSAVVLNNLAWTLLTSDPPDLRAALSSAEGAVSLSPGDPSFRDTRFRILARLGRWQEALEDLEFCAPAMAGKPDFHRAAAEVYDHLQLPDLAAEHRRLAGDK